MKKKNLAAALILLILTLITLSPAMAAEQNSTVQQTGTTLYVNAAHPNASDSNPGTSASSPLRTVTAALARQRSNVTIRIAAGTYREYVALQNTSNVVIEADAGAVLSAFDIITGWRAESDGTFSAPVQILSTASNGWPNDVSLTYAAGVRSPVFANGQRLMPVSGTPNNGQFALRSGRLYVRNTTYVEYGVRQYALMISGSNNITVRGLTVEGCAHNVAMEGCLHIASSQNITIENVTANRANYSGIQITGSSRVTVRNMVGNDNGVRGFGAASSSDILLDGAQLHRNGARTEWFAGSSKPLEYWDGGNKVFTCTRCTFRGMDIRDTFGPGFWVDWRNISLVIENTTIHNSHGSGIFVEAHCDAPSVTLRNVTITHTRTMSTNNAYLNADLFITGTNHGIYENVRIVSSTLNAVLVNNYNRNVGNCAPVRGTNNVFTGLQIERTTNGNFIQLFNTSSGYPGSTRIVGTTAGSGTYRIDSQTLNVSQFVSRLASGSQIGSGGSVQLPTNTPAPSATTPAPVPPTVEPPAGLPPAGSRVTNGIQVLYTFHEGKGNVVTDVSGVGTPMNLTINNTGAVTWSSSGLTLNSSTIIRSSGAASKVINAAKASNAITIELWVRPAAAQQGSNAPRIITLSADGTNRNFSLTHGVWESPQPLALFDMRTRTSSTDNNGMPSFGTPNGTLTTSLTHVVYTFSSGVGTLYINGVQQAQRTIGGNLSNWNNTMALALGNEFTGDRAWRGTYRLVAIYGRALSLQEINQNYVAGGGGGIVIAPTNTPTTAPTNTPLPTNTPTNTPVPPTATNMPTNTPVPPTAQPPTSQPVGNSGRVTSGIQVLYTFNEGRGNTVNDISGVGTPLNLTINNTNAVTWNSSGLTLNSSTIIRSSGAASKVINAAKASNAITVEAWIRPASASQGGPARIVSLSADQNNRDFTLGMGNWNGTSAAVFDMRVRTSSTDNNGLPSLTTANGTATTGLQHVVYTFSNGVGTLYVNGVQQAQRTIGGNLSNWNTTMGLALGNEFTGDRAWRGTYRLVAIYGRALSRDEILQNYNAGADNQVIVIAPTNTPVPPTATNTPVPPTATNTPTNTPVPPTATNTPTNTPVPPTATNTPTNTPVPPTATNTPTNTPVPPTATNTPTNTPVPPTATNTPTNTPVPPTAQPTSQPVNNGGRVTSGIQVLYTFNEGRGSVIYDVSGVGTPLNLGIADPSAVTWSSGGLTINRSTIIATGNPVSTLPQAIKATNEITIEAWVRPTNTQQSGPARIVTLSSDHYNRNFTLGMGNWNGTPSSNYDVRLRSRGTDTNGLPSLSSSAGAMATSVAHVVFTRSADGVERLYINGIEYISRNMPGTLSNWADNYRLALGNELTGDRPWLGTYYLVAIYNRALTVQEVAQNFNAGTGGGSTQVAMAAQPELAQPITQPEQQTESVQAAPVEPVAPQPSVEPQTSVEAPAEVTAEPVVSEPVVIDQAAQPAQPGVVVIATTEPAATLPPTPEPTRVPLPLPVYATFDAGAPDWSVNGSWALNAAGAYGGLGLGWQSVPTGTPAQLTWLQPLDLRAAQRPTLTFQTVFVGSYSATVEISMDNVSWSPIGFVTSSGSSTWQEVIFNLEPYRGTPIWLRWSYLPGVQPPAAGDMWLLDNISVIDRPLVDTDADGFTDDVDACPSVAGSLNGCPADTDADGFTDDVDACPSVAGALNGCPADTDADGFTDDVDACPFEAGIENGCPAAVQSAPVDPAAAPADPAAQPPAPEATAEPSAEG